MTEKNVLEATDQPRTALIAGSSGAVGRHLIQFLLESNRYRQVISLVRRPSGLVHPRLLEKVVSFDELGSLSELTQVDDVYCSLGTTRKRAGSAEAFRKVDYDYVMQLGLLSKKLKARRFSVISSIGAGNKGRGLYLQTKTDMEQGLRAMKFPALLIFRPSLLRGERDGFRMGETLGYWGLSALKMIPGVKRYQPVATEQVARTMVAATLKADAGVSVLENLQIKDLI